MPGELQVIGRGEEEKIVRLSSPRFASTAPFALSDDFPQEAGLA